MSTCLPHAELHRYVRGELDGAHNKRVREHLDRCDACRSSVTVLTEAAAGSAATVSMAADATQSLVGDATESMAGTPGSRRKMVMRYPKIDGYQITGVLGQGGMGIVYRAVQNKLSRTVALKVLPAVVGTASRNAVARFRREATSAARLHHTNIVPIYDFGESEDGSFYAMELIEGKTLDVLIRRFAEQSAASATTHRLADLLHTSTPTAMIAPAGPGTDASGTHQSSAGSDASAARGSRPYYRQVASWMADAAEALHYAHEHGIIHRDVKPSNFILSTDGRIMLADFGLAKGAGGESVTMTGTMVGTLRYMSPEQTMARRVPIDHRTDIYSLGATLYELLCFRPAFTGDDQKVILSEIISREPTRPRKVTHTVPAELETICLKCLEKSSDARYATGQALAEDLRRYLSDLPISAKRPGPIRRTIKLIRRHQAASVALTAIFLLFGAVGLSINIESRRKIAEAESRLAQAEALKAQVQEHIAEGLRLQAAPTMTPAATRKKLFAAAKHYQSALTLEAGQWRALANLAVVKKELFNNQEVPDQRLLEEALDLCDRALAEEQESPELWNLKGVVLKKLGRYDLAVGAYQNATEGNPDGFEGWNNLGVVQALAGKLDEAEESLGRAGRLTGVIDPCHPHVWRNLASLQNFRHRPEADQSIKQAVACGPDDAWSNVIRARLRLTPGASYDPAEALVDMKLAARLGGPSEPRLARLLAVAHLRNSHFIDAIGHARAALAVGDLAAINQFIIALAEAALGNQKAAQQSYTAALEAWPPELSGDGDFIASARGGVLWFDSHDELSRLKAETQARFVPVTTSP